MVGEYAATKEHNLELEPHQTNGHNGTIGSGTIHCLASTRHSPSSFLFSRFPLRDNLIPVQRKKRPQSTPPTSSNREDLANIDKIGY